MRVFTLAGVLAIAMAGATLVACGDDDGDDANQMNTGDGDGDTGSTGDGDGGGSTVGTCNTTTAPSSTQVAETQVNDAPPAAQGGSIQDGVYHLTEFNVHAPASADGNTRAVMLEVSGNKIVSVTVRGDGSKEVMGGTFSMSGDQITLSITCPSVGSKTMPYTATDTEIRLQDDEPNVQVYTKQ